MRISSHVAAILAAGSLSVFALAPAQAGGDKSAQSGASQGGQVQTTAGQQSTGASAGSSGQMASQSGQSMDEDKVRRVQQALSQEGHDLQVDGKWGPNTQDALRKFQEKRGLQPTGQLTDETMAALDIDEAGGSATATSTPGSSGSSGSGMGSQGGQGSGNSGMQSPGATSGSGGSMDQSGSGSSGSTPRQ